MKKQNPPTAKPRYFPEDYRSPQACEFMKGDSLSVLKKSTQRCFDNKDMMQAYSDPSRLMSDRARFSGGATVHLGPQKGKE